ncbi:MAG: hypothetical protein PHQ17_01845 [Methanobacterium sp.]|jgi:hypothetical protein|nr:hypothetical protein [Methanobacterium sp.]
MERYIKLWEKPGFDAFKDYESRIDVVIDMVLMVFTLIGLKVMKTKR